MYTHFTRNTYVYTYAYTFCEEQWYPEIFLQALMLMSQWRFSETEFFWLFIACISWEFALWFPWTFQISDESLRRESRSQRRVDAQSRRVCSIQTIIPSRLPDRVMQQKCRMSSGWHESARSMSYFGFPGQGFWPERGILSLNPCNITLLLNTYVLNIKLLLIENLCKNKATIFEICFSP